MLATDSGQIERDFLHGANVELRKFKRHQLRVPVVFSWLGPEDFRQQGEGITRDISAGGAFVVTSTLPPLKTTLQLDVTFPRLSGSRQALRMHASGTVVRVEPKGDSPTLVGFAVSSECFFLRNVQRMTPENSTGDSRESER